MLTESTRLRGRQSSLRAYYALKSLREGSECTQFAPTALDICIELDDLPVAQEFDL